jgi:hypothetical protein
MPPKPPEGQMLGGRLWEESGMGLAGADLGHRSRAIGFGGDAIIHTYEDVEDGRHTQLTPDVYSYLSMTSWRDG